MANNLFVCSVKMSNLFSMNFFWFYLIDEDGICTFSLCSLEAVVQCVILFILNGERMIEWSTLFFVPIRNFSSDPDEAR